MLKRTRAVGLRLIHLAALSSALALVGAARARGAALVPAGSGPVRASPGGDAQTYQIDSSVLGETRRVLVVLPESHADSAASRRYPVTVVLDGEHLLPSVAAVSEVLAANGQIPESVIVGIENVRGSDDADTNRKRAHDLTPPGLSVSGSSEGEGGDRFLDFIAGELLPALDAQLRTGPPRMLVGLSSGGFLATYAAATRDTYGVVVSIDAPVQLGQGWLAEKLLQRARTAGSPLRYASLEAQFGWRDSAWKALTERAPASWRLFRERLAPAESHETVPMLAAYLGLREAFRDYSLLAVADLPSTSVLSHYAGVGESLGARVAPPRKELQRLVDDLLAEGRGSAAREAFELLTAAYGRPLSGDELEARIAAAETGAEQRETVEQLLATPFPSPEEARPFLGEWVGDILMAPQQPRTGSTRLRISVVDGKVVGETIVADAPPEFRVRRWQYLRTTAEGLTWGLLNGMRPRGLVLFEGKLEGDALQGKSRFGGIDFRQPDGTPPPPLHFSFRRVRPPPTS